MIYKRRDAEHPNTPQKNKTASEPEKIFLRLDREN